MKLFIALFSKNVSYLCWLILDVLWGQLIKFVHVIPTSELHEYCIRTTAASVAKLSDAKPSVVKLPSASRWPNLRCFFPLAQISQRGAKSLSGVFTHSNQDSFWHLFLGDLSQSKKTFWDLVTLSHKVNFSHFTICFHKLLTSWIKDWNISLQKS